MWLTQFVAPRFDPSIVVYMEEDLANNPNSDRAKR
jgi:hypothetical protein